MPYELKYGYGEVLQLDVPSDAVLADGSVPQGTPLDDPETATVEALAAPLDFPPLSRAVIPGDKIVLALEYGIAEAGSIVSGAVRTLLEAGASAGDIRVMLAPGSNAASLEAALSKLSPPVRNEIAASIHDPHEAECSFLATNRDGHPILFNRRLVDADFVLPVSTLRLPESFGYRGVQGGLFPVFSDAATHRRFWASSQGEGSQRRQRLRDESDEAAWLLGIQCVVQVNPGPGDRVMHVLAGNSQSAARRGGELCAAAWLHRAPRQADLVIATIEGGAEQQTWTNLTRALFAASQAVCDGGAIVLCTRLFEPPGPAIRELADPRQDTANGRGPMRRARCADLAAADVFREACRRVTVYLLSGLDGELVEDLGLGHVNGPFEIQRLIRHGESCILLGNAQHAMLVTNQERPDEEGSPHERRAKSRH